MATTAPRFSRKTLQFLEKAARQKNPLWLDRNREAYETHLLSPLRHLARHLKSSLAPDAFGYHFPQKGIGRIKRSALRAKEHGSVFKDWVSYSAARPRQSRFEHNPNLFFLIQVDDDEGDHVLSAGGLYMPSSKQTRAIREAIAQNAEPFDRLFASKKFAVLFPGGFSDERISSRVPRGFDPSHPRMDWLRLQAFFVWRAYSMREFSSADFPEKLARDFRQITRLNALLDQALSGKWQRPKEKPGSGRSPRFEIEIPAPRHKMDF